MKRASWLLALVVLLFAGAGPVHGDSTPKIHGAVRGFELCPQTVCHVAIFAGVFQGLVGVNPQAVGTMAVAVTHEPLPDPGHWARITGGQWSLWVGVRRFEGSTSGWLFNNGNNTYTATVDMTLERGGLGAVSFVGLLDHNTFPPTISGLVSQ